MRNFPTVLGSSALQILGATATALGQSTGSDAPFQPVRAPVRPVTDDYYGTTVVDNYRYLEDPKDPEVRQWMKSQADYTQAILGRIPGRKRLLARLRELDDSPEHFRSRAFPLASFTREKP